MNPQVLKSLSPPILQSANASILKILVPTLQFFLYIIKVCNIINTKGYVNSLLSNKMTKDLKVCQCIIHVECGYILHDTENKELVLSLLHYRTGQFLEPTNIIWYRLIAGWKMILAHSSVQLDTKLSRTDRQISLLNI